MITMSRFAKLNALRRDFLAAEKGSVMITFAIALVPLVGLIGASVDYSRASAIRTAMQSAVDSTALALSSSASSQTATQLQSGAQSYFNALFTRADAQNVAVTATYSSSGGSQVKVTGSAQMQTSFMGIMGFPTLNIGVSSTSTWGMSRLRVALALDNTGSMSSAGKITALKTASKNLLSQLQTAAQKNGDVYVSIIPFSKDVNVGGPTNYNANWIDWTDWDAANGGWQYVGLPNWGDTADAGWNLNWNGNWPSPDSPFVRVQWGGGWGGGGDGGGWGGGGGGGGGGTTKTWVPDNHNTWNGCITDRDQDYDIKNTTPNPTDVNLAAGIARTLFPAEQYGSCPVEMMGLSYNWTQLNQKIDSMYPNGNTNQAIGLAWAWQSLTQGAPLNAPAEDTGYQYQKVIILLTDGLNTQNRWTSSQSVIDARQKLMCDNVKKAGITLYTIQVNTSGDPTSALLQYCATDSSKFFILTSANAIVTTFKLIGDNLSKLRIAK